MLSSARSRRAQEPRVHAEYRLPAGSDPTSVQEPNPSPAAREMPGRAEPPRATPSASCTCSGDTSMVTVVKELENPASD